VLTLFRYQKKPLCDLAVLFLVGKNGKSLNKYSVCQVDKSICVVGKRFRLHEEQRCGTAKQPCVVAKQPRANAKWRISVDFAAFTVTARLLQVAATQAGVPPR
jgi:hypothetical protein